mgnify:CR=1 FL=1
MTPLRPRQFARLTLASVLLITAGVGEMATARVRAAQTAARDASSTKTATANAAPSAAASDGDGWKRAAPGRLITLPADHASQRGTGRTRSTTAAATPTAVPTPAPIAP